MSFSEVRAYQFGDDVRNIDWNVTARSGEPHIKIFEEERDLSVLLMADMSGSAFWGSTDRSKQEWIAEICATLAISADGNHDKVGLLLFSEKPELYLPPKKGHDHSLRLIRELLNAEPSEKGTSISAAIQFTYNILKKRSICFILSDFQDEGYESSLRMLSRRHDVVGLHCFDPRERDLPDLGLVRWRSGEGGQEQWIDSSDPDVRRQHTAVFEQNLARATNTFRLAGADFLSLSTTQDFTSPLRELFEKRTNK